MQDPCADLRRLSNHARQQKRKLESAKDRGETITPNKMKVEEYLLEWLETYQKPEVTKTTTSRRNLDLADDLAQP